MTESGLTFLPISPLLPGSADPQCRACVTIPARNEEASLTRCLDALLRQVDVEGRPLPARSFEVLLLLNNCTDATPAVAHRWRQEHPSMVLHVLERALCAEEAHVGTARRLLMDTAWWRLRDSQLPVTAILSSDADSAVAPDWIARNLQALSRGADVVGGSVVLLKEDRLRLPDSVRRCYAQDRRYAGLVAQLEDALDPRPGDRSPRHLDHFGSSLACSPAAYAAAGGMPAVSPLEDEAFVGRVRRADLVLRHDPLVRVYTSARLEGRATVGMAGQLRLWEQMPQESLHRVPSAAFLEHRFRTLKRLRDVFDARDTGDLRLPTDWWRETFAEALRNETTCAGFLGAVYCDTLISEAFPGCMEEPIAAAIQGLESRLKGQKNVGHRMRKLRRPVTQETASFSASVVSG